jgi:hypothetical protein
MEPYAGAEYNLTSSIVNSKVQLSIPTSVQRERGGVGKVTPIGWDWAHLYLSANFHNMLFMST